MVFIQGLFNGKTPSPKSRSDKTNQKTHFKIHRTFPEIQKA